MTEPLLDRKPFIVTGNCGDKRTDRIGKLQTFFRFKTMQITVQVAGIKAVTRPTVSTGATGKASL